MHLQLCLVMVRVANFPFLEGKNANFDSSIGLISYCKYAINKPGNVVGNWPFSFGKDPLGICNSDGEVHSHLSAGSFGNTGVCMPNANASSVEPLKQRGPPSVKHYPPLQRNKRLSDIKQDAPWVDQRTIFHRFMRRMLSENTCTGVCYSPQNGRCADKCYDGVMWPFVDHVTLRNLRKALNDVFISGRYLMKVFCAAVPPAGCAWPQIGCDPNHPEMWDVKVPKGRTRKDCPSSACDAYARSSRQQLGEEWGWRRRKVPTGAVEQDSKSKATRRRRSFHLSGHVGSGLSIALTKIVDKLPHYARFFVKFIKTKILPHLVKFDIAGALQAIKSDLEKRHEGGSGSSLAEALSCAVPEVVVHLRKCKLLFSHSAFLLQVKEVFGRRTDDCPPKLLNNAENKGERCVFPAGLEIEKLRGRFIAPIIAQEQCEVYRNFAPASVVKDDQQALEENFSIEAAFAEKEVCQSLWNKNTLKYDNVPHMKEKERQASEAEKQLWQATKSMCIKKYAGIWNISPPRVSRLFMLRVPMLIGRAFTLNTQHPSITKWTQCIADGLEAGNTELRSMNNYTTHTCMAMAPFNTWKKSVVNNICTSELLLTMDVCSTCCCKAGMISTGIDHRMVQGSPSQCALWFSMTDALLRVLIGLWRAAMVGAFFGKPCLLVSAFNAQHAALDRRQ